MSASEAITAAVYDYLAATPAKERLGEGNVIVKIDLRPPKAESDEVAGVMWLSTAANPPHSKPLLEEALARVRYGFESDAIPGWRGDLAADPEVKIHDDPELGATVQTLEVDLTAKRR